MEIPPDLAALYRHWAGHTGVQPCARPACDSGLDVALLAQIGDFVRERISIWEQKTTGRTPPYTHDPILATYRFCNIFREFDRQTIEYHTLLAPLRHDFPLWLLNMFYCRMVARPDTVRAVGLLSYREYENRKLQAALLAHPRPRYGTPYVFPVSVIMKSATPTRESFIAVAVPARMQAVASLITGWNKKSVYAGVEEVLPVFGFGLRFLWTEVLIDVAYQYPELIDLYARFPVGPGSAPTMRRLERSVDPSRLVVQLAQIPFATDITFGDVPLQLSAENWEGIGCEFRKYENLRHGTGRRRLYRAG